MAFSFFSTGSGANEVNFIPEVFSKLLQAKFYKQSVLPAISNTDYQGEISGQGDKVIIRTVPAVTINDYAGTVTVRKSPRVLWRCSSTRRSITASKLTMS